MTPNAFVELLRPHYDDVARYCRLLCAPYPASAAEDVLQVALITAFEKVGGLKDRSRFRPWLLRIVQRTFLMDRRRRSVRRMLPLPETEPEQSDLYDAYEHLAWKESLLAALAEAKAQYGYDALLAEKQAYEQEGKAAAQAKVDALLGTDQTLVRIAYGAVSADPPGLGFTPFGVTPLEDGRAIYELVPISVRFGDDSSLSMQVATPVLVDTVQREMLFVVDVPTAEINAVRDVVKTEAFVVKGRVANVEKVGNEVRIELR